MTDLVLETRPLGFPWETIDPFLFCVHHDDAYPAGNEKMGPAVSLAGRQLGQDFVIKDGFRMYHGETVPGFPQHPHRGFETVTIVLRGLIDHSDSLGATARFGNGDVQWLTAGGGICHSEMFPLLEREKPNPLELFQIWLNLPAEDKLAPAHFAMLWSTDIPKVVSDGTEITVIAGELEGKKGPPPPPKSWASRANTDVAIWLVRMKAKGRFSLPPAKGEETMRTLYFFRGSSVDIGGKKIDSPSAIIVRPDLPIPLEAGDSDIEVLLLQGRPIGEPIAAPGPFVMNTRAEIQNAFEDYRRTRFGGWPWASDDPVHPRDEGRFAKHADGRLERHPLSSGSEETNQG